jgi:hypothetical protein
VNTSQASWSGKSRRTAAGLAISVATIIMLLATTLFLGGCSVQAGLDTKVNPDGSGTVGIRLSADKELQDALSDLADGLGGRVGGILGILGDLGGVTNAIPQSADDLFNLIVGQIPGDWEAERGTDSTGARWLTLTRSFSNPEELEEILSGGFLSSVIATDQFSLTQDKGFFSTKTVFSAKANAGSVTSRAQSAADMAGRIVGQVFVIDNRITLPGSIKDNNADEVQGNTLIWAIELSGPNDMYAESVMYNWGAIIGVTIAGVIVIAAIIIALVLVLRRRRRPTPPEQPAVLEPAQATSVAETDGPEAAAADAPRVVVPGEVGQAPPPVAPRPPVAPTPPVAPMPPVAPTPPAPATSAVVPPPPVASPAPVDPVTPAAPAAATAAAATTATTPDDPTRPIVPIPLRPTKTAPTSYYTLASAGETAAQQRTEQMTQVGDGSADGAVDESSGAANETAKSGADEEAPSS